jgi:hypothetical protein
MPNVESNVIAMVDSFNDEIAKKPSAISSHQSEAVNATPIGAASS